VRRVRTRAGLTRIPDAPRRPKAAPPSLGIQVAEQIAQAIIRGEFSPGQWITEEELTRLYRVSRSPVREGLRTLASEGLVELAPRRGASVARHDVSMISNLYECRNLLEPECFRITAPRLSAETFKELEEVFREMTEAASRDEPESYLAATVRFHEVVHAVCPNTVLRDLIRFLWRRILLLRHIIIHLPGRLPRSLELHRQIFEAIAHRDGEAAARAVRDLVQDSHTVLFSAIHPGLSRSADGHRLSTRAITNSSKREPQWPKGGDI